MIYSPEQFFRLVELIQEDGGVQLDELCSARQYTFTGPVGKRPGKVLTMPGCGNYSIFSLPYEGEGGKKSSVRLCAVCDDIGQTPRYRECLEAH